MKKSNIFLSLIFVASFFFFAFDNLETKRNGENKELIQKMNKYLNLSTYQLSLEEKMDVIESHDALIEALKKNHSEIPNSPDWDCASLYWGKFSNCWEGLAYFERGSDKWIQEVGKCFSNVSKCFEKCEKEKSTGGAIQ